MALGFRQVLSPRVKSVAAKQESMNGGVALQQSLDLHMPVARCPGNSRRSGGFHDVRACERRSSL